MADDVDPITQFKANDADAARKVLAAAASLTEDPAPSCPFFKSKIEVIAQTLRGIAAQLVRE
jgi:hypothetical protein